MCVCVCILMCSESSRSNAHLQNGETPYTVRNYTIVGNYKVGFPQWRIMKVMYPEATGGGGPPILRAGEEVYVLGRSHKRGYLIVEHNGKQLHLPHHFTELRVSWSFVFCCIFHHSKITAGFGYKYSNYKN